jgi:DHA1 family bicyclomycin/chloramphenicol resistance-like MFS transporter
MSVLVGLVDMASDLYVPVLPEIGRVFQVSESWVGATISINLISLALSGLFYGSLSDSIGRKPVIIGGLSLFIVSSFACGFSTNVYELLVARFFQGLGGGVAFSVGVAVVRDLYEGGAKGAQMYSRMQSVIALSPAFAPIIGGIIGTIYGWAWIFYTLSIIALVLFIAILFFGKETLPPQQRHKKYSIDFAQKYQYLLSRHIFLCYAGVQILSLGWFWSELAFFPALFQDHYGIAADSFGIYLGILMLAYILGTFINQYVVHRVCLKKLVWIGIMLFFFSAFAMSAAQYLNFISPWIIVALRFPAGIGFALLFGNAGTLAIDQETEHTGSASALIGASELLAGAICIFIIEMFEAVTIYPLSLIIIGSSALCVWLMTKAKNLEKESGVNQNTYSSMKQDILFK